MKRSRDEDDPSSRFSEKIVLQILIRLPLKLAVGCKLVCKSWLNLISDPVFAKSHVEFSKANNEPYTLVLQKDNILSTLKFRDPTDISKGATLARFKRFPSDYVLDVNDNYYFVVGSSNGLICAYVKSVGKRRRDDLLTLWNPCTDEELEISAPIEGVSFYVHVESGWFGCVPSCDYDYKIFLVYTLHNKRGPRETGMFVYSFSDEEWIDVSNEAYDCISKVNSVFFDEALHYLVDRKWIVIFDLVEETFKKVPFSIEPDELPKCNQSSLGVIGEYKCLCAMFVHESEDWMVELWTLEEYDDWDSWEKMYCIDLREQIIVNCMQFLGFTYNGNLCIQQANGLVLVDTDEDPPSYVVARNPSLQKVYRVMDYVESLVSPSSL